jgi:hypothetical protein
MGTAQPQQPSPELVAQMLRQRIADANEGVTHQEFAAGAQSGTIGFKCMITAFSGATAVVRSGSMAAMQWTVLFYLSG